jgi:hypothetical protein
MRSEFSLTRPRLILAMGFIAFASPALLLIANDPSAPPAKAAAVPPPIPASQPVWTKEKKDEETARVMDFFQAAQPDAYDQAKILRDSDPQKFDEMVRKMAGMVSRFEDMKKKHPALFEMNMKYFAMEYKSVELGKQIKSTETTGPEHDRLMQQLTQLVADQFDIKQKMRQSQIDDLQRQLTDLEKQSQDRAADRDDMIKKRVDSLIETVPEWDW